MDSHSDKALKNIAILMSKGQAAEARQKAHDFLKASYACDTTVNQIAMLFVQGKDLDFAANYYLASLSHFRDSEMLVNGFVDLVVSCGRADLAEDVLINFLRSNKNSASAWSNLAVVKRNIGDIDTAHECLHVAVNINPHYRHFWSNYLTNMNYVTSVSTEIVNKAHREFFDWFSKDVSQFSHADHDWVAGRKLRIGFVSPDFREHAAKHYIMPIAKFINRDEFEIRAYAEVKTVDAIGKRYQSLFDNWYSTYGKSAYEVAERIKADKIDILIEMAGHTAGNRLDAIFHKPAPIIAHWMGYSSSLMMDQVDYWIADRFVNPPNFDWQFNEQVIRMPNTMRPFQAKEVDLKKIRIEPPLLQDGRVKFCALYSAFKLNKETLAAWAKILDSVPNSIIVMAVKSSDKHFIQRLAACGIPQDRVEIHRWLDLDAYESIMASCDLTLDTLYFNGATTTLQSLSLGVPVVTMSSGTPRGNIATAILDQIGLASELSTSTVEEYVARAVEICKDPEKLRRLREMCREGITKSYGNDAEWVSAFEGTLRQIWTTRCRKELASNS